MLEEPSGRDDSCLVLAEKPGHGELPGECIVNPARRNNQRQGFWQILAYSREQESIGGLSETVWSHKLFFSGRRKISSKPTLYHSYGY